MSLLNQIWKEKWASLLVFLSGSIAGFMLQKNWLFTVQESTFEKDVLVRYWIGTPVIGGLIFGLWILFLGILRPAFSEETFSQVIRRDAVSMLSLLTTVAVMWSPPLSPLLLGTTALLWGLLKIVLYPKALYEAFRYFWNNLTHPVPLQITFSKNANQGTLILQGEINTNTAILVKEKITQLFEEVPLAKLTVDLSELSEITPHSRGILLLLQGECLLHNTHLVVHPPSWHTKLQDGFPPKSG